MVSTDPPRSLIERAAAFRQELTPTGCKVGRWLATRPAEYQAEARTLFLDGTSVRILRNLFRDDGLPVSYETVLEHRRFVRGEPSSCQCGPA